MPSVVVVEAKRALVALLAARPALADVQVAYGWPGDDELEVERIFAGRARATDKPSGLRAGRTHYAEAGTFEVVVQVEDVDGGPEEAETRCLELGREVALTVADNRTLGDVPGLLAVTVDSWELVNGYGTAGGSLAELVFTVAYQARLT